ncbi:hypothetical protein CR513_37805, partial [Mucuna pruriens]
MVRWTVELLKFDISYERRGHIKAQVLANFIIELAPIEEANKLNKEWTLPIDGASNKKGNEVGGVLEGPNGVLIKQFLHFEFRARNNQVEYETLLVRMRLAKELGAQILTTKSDSQLATSFERFILLHVQREQNEQDDLLSKLATTQKSGFNRSIIQEMLHRLTIERAKIRCASANTSWMSLIINYFQNDEVSANLLNAKKLRREASKYILITQWLYRRGFSYPLLKCLDPNEARYAMRGCVGRI